MAFEGVPDAGSTVLHTPAVSLSSRPCRLSQLSVYSPTTPQLPGEAHETERRETSGFEAALAGNGAEALSPSSRSETPALHAGPRQRSRQAHRRAPAGARGADMIGSSLRARRRGTAPLVISLSASPHSGSVLRFPVRDCER